MNNNRIPAIKITYEELVSLRDNSQLSRGQRYQITDYETTVNPTVYPDYKSAKHQFDIIVTAKDNSSLYEEAMATHHIDPETGAVDPYFEHNDLSKWVIKYSLDNDQDKFKWAVNKAIDEDVVVVFDDKDRKSICKFYSSFKIIESSDGAAIDIRVYWLTSTPTVYEYYIEKTNGEGFFANGYINWDENFYEVFEIYQSEPVKNKLTTTLTENAGKGVIYYLKDEFNNEATYDFKNTLFDGKYTFNYSGGQYYYEKTEDGGNEVKDASLSEVFNVYNNKIDNRSTGYYKLNKNVFEGEYFNKNCLINSSDNTFTTEQSNIDFYYSHNNTLKQSCANIKLDDCGGMVFEGNSYDINCYNSYAGTFNYYCRHINFPTHMSKFTIGRNCSNIVSNVSIAYGAGPYEGELPALVIGDSSNNISIKSSSVESTSLGALHIGSECSNIQIDCADIYHDWYNIWNFTIITVQDRVHNIKLINHDFGEVSYDKMASIEINEGDCIYV